MTILKSFGCLLLTAAVFFACSEDDGSISPTLPGPNVTAEFFEANVALQRVSGTPVSYEPSFLLSVSYAGHGTSNMMSSLTMEASHIEEITEDRNDFRIEQGQFVLRSDEGEEIFGIYRGHGSKSVTRAQLDWSLRIQGGTGRFSSAQGTLLVSASDPTLTDNGILARISGNVALKSQI